MQNFGVEGGPVNCNTHNFVQREALTPFISNDGSSARRRTPLFKKGSYPGSEITYYALVGSANSGGAYLDESENSSPIPGQPLSPGLLQIPVRFNSWVWRNSAGEFNDAHIDLAPLPSNKGNLILREVVEVMSERDSIGLSNFLVDPETKSLFTGTRICVSDPAIGGNHDMIGLNLNGELLFAYGSFGTAVDNRRLSQVMPSGGDWNRSAGFNPYRYVPAQTDQEKTDFEVEVAGINFLPDKRKKEYYKHSPYIGEVLASGELLALSISVGFRTNGYRYEQIANQLGDQLKKGTLTEAGLRSVVDSYIGVRLAVAEG